MGDTFFALYLLFLLSANCPQKKRVENRGAFARTSGGEAQKRGLAGRTSGERADPRRQRSEGVTAQEGEAKKRAAPVRADPRGGHAPGWRP